MFMLDLTRGAVGSSFLPGRLLAGLLIQPQQNGARHGLFPSLDQRRDCGANLVGTVLTLNALRLQLIIGCPRDDPRWPLPPALVLVGI